MIPPTHRRVFLAGIAAILATFAGLTAWGLLTGTVLPLPWLWPLAFGAAAVLSVLWAIRSTTSVLHLAAGATATAAFAGRGSVIGWNLVIDEPVTQLWRDLLAVTLWGGLAFVTLWVFLLLWQLDHAPPPRSR